MTIKQAVQELILHDEFIKCAKLRTKQGAKLRMFRVRFNRGLIDNAGLIQLLEQFKYQIQITIIKKPNFFYNENCEK
jgi:hypothetical protein